MSLCLIALGSNLGDRTENLRRAIVAMSGLERTSVEASSSWHESCPIGGPGGQDPFLNAAALLSTSLEPSALLTELLRIEAELGRQQTVRWGARTLDLDIAIYDGIVIDSAELTLPHPRMSYRRFVLEPAAEVAPWMVDPQSGWTVQRLLEHLNHGSDVIAVAADPYAANDLVRQIAQRLSLATEPQEVMAFDWPAIAPWTPTMLDNSSSRPKLILALESTAGTKKRKLPKMMQLPPTGPVAWIGAGADQLQEALAAIQAVWPALAIQSISRD